jgi:hypothetical protein
MPERRCRAAAEEWRERLPASRGEAVLQADATMLRDFQVKPADGGVSRLNVPDLDLPCARWKPDVAPHGRVWVTVHNHGAHHAEPARINDADMTRQRLADIDAYPMRGRVVVQLIAERHTEQRGGVAHGNSLVAGEPVRRQARSDVDVGIIILVRLEEQDIAQQRHQLCRGPNRAECPPCTTSRSPVL